MPCPCWVNIRLKKTDLKFCSPASLCLMQRRQGWRRKGVLFLIFLKSFCKHQILTNDLCCDICFLHVFWVSGKKHLPKLPFFPKAICIDSEEEAVAPRKRRRKTGQFQARISTGAFKSLGKNEGWITGVGERESILEEIQIQCKGLCT